MCIRDRNILVTPRLKHLRYSILFMQFTISLLFPLGKNHSIPLHKRESYSTKRQLSSTIIHCIISRLNKRGGGGAFKVTFTNIRTNGLTIDKMKISAQKSYIQLKAQMSCKILNIFYVKYKYFKQSFKIRLGSSFILLTKVLVNSKFKSLFFDSH